jgi:two-component system response regulator VicR
MKVLFFSRDGERVEQLALALRLRWPDLNPLIVSQGGVGIQAVEQEEPDLVMLCEELPDMSLWLAIREIRKLSDIPLILTVESDNDMDVVRALELGADDYINSVSRIVGQTRFQMASAKNDRPMNRVQMHPDKG